jgi:hypothetical protein
MPKITTIRTKVVPGTASRGLKDYLSSSVPCVLMINNFEHVKPSFSFCADTKANKKAQGMGERLVPLPATQVARV